MMPRIDFHFYKEASYTLIIAAILFFSGNYLIPFYSESAVKVVEHTQSLMLLFMTIYTYFYLKRYPYKSDKYQFWLWTMFWWFLLFGRGISWGRDFFPEVPKIYFRIISIVFFTPVVLGFLFPAIRREIVRRYKYEKIPFWYILFAFIFLGLSDQIEHHRIGYDLLLSDPARQDLIEELLEIPCLLSIAFVVFYLQRNEKEEKAKD
ncbi:hypothetical protein [Zophobihabitans entericus]|uniref:Uncharacterized protein n=1 Tax=Zophobihabitans entericus TaxID=1635327 RepID=A0A6G9IB68_9GAMM|nr:hypothetical protein [Zophobihabitans entericus]QIQ21077.1 hypothetical protein IPMB12_04905 [Zophobihabitans entericus]